MLPLCLGGGHRVIPWSPLARGFLDRGRKREGYGDTKRAPDGRLRQSMYYQEADFEIAGRVAELAGRRGVPRTGRPGLAVAPAG